MTSFLGSVYRSKAPLEISVDEGPEVVTVESTGLASMFQGMVLGEYYRLEDHCRAACYAQSHSDLGEAPVYLYKSERDGAWYVDSQLDSVSGRLYNPSTGDSVPTEGWQVRVNKATDRREEDPLLVISARGTIPVCSKITVRVDERPEYSGSYTPTLQYSAGRIVFHNSDHGTWLLHQPSASVWCITSDPLGSSAALVSGGSSLCPADPVARVGGWRYWGEGWVRDPSITVSCRNHKYRRLSRVSRV